MPHNGNENHITVTPLHEPKSGCGDRKRTYDTINEARRAAAYSWSKTGCNLGVYKCRQCGKFHITHQLGHRGNYVRFVASPNFSGMHPNGVEVGWRKEGNLQKTNEEIAEERKVFFAKIKAEKEKLNRTRRKIRWKDRGEGEDF